jgi:hypothetical protein
MFRLIYFLLSVLIALGCNNNDSVPNAMVRVLTNHFNS